MYFIYFYPIVLDDKKLYVNEFISINIIYIYLDIYVTNDYAGRNRIDVISSERENTT